MKQFDKKTNFDGGYIDFPHNKRMNLSPGRLGAKNGKSNENFFNREYDKMFPKAIWEDNDSFDPDDLRKYNGRLVIVKKPRINSNSGIITIPENLFVNTANKRFLTVETKFYDTTGGTIGKIVYEWPPKTRRMGINSILLLTGSGWSRRELDKFEDEIDGKNGMPKEPYILSFCRYEECGRKSVENFISNELKL